MEIKPLTAQTLENLDYIVLEGDKLHGGSNKIEKWVKIDDVANDRDRDEIKREGVLF